MPAPTVSKDQHCRRQVVSLRLDGTELMHLDQLVHMGRCASRGELLRRLLDQAHAQMILDLARW